MGSATRRRAAPSTVCDSPPPNELLPLFAGPPNPLERTLPSPDLPAAARPRPDPVTVPSLRAEEAADGGAVFVLVMVANGVRLKAGLGAGRDREGGLGGGTNRPVMSRSLSST